MPYFGKLLAYSWEVEIYRRLHKSFAIVWKILEVMILELLPNTNYIFNFNWFLDMDQIYTKRILYNVPIGVKYFCFEMNVHMFGLSFF